jgi:hypothetical protein
MTSVALVLGMSTVPAVSALAAPGSPARTDETSTAGPSGPERSADHRSSTSSINVLVFHGPAAEQDDPVTKAVAAIEEMGAADGFDVDEATDPAVFSDQNLDRYRGVVFLSAEGADLNAGQEDALQRFIEDGNGFLGVHDAARAQARSDWFTGLVGTRPAGNLPTPLAV